MMSNRGKTCSNGCPRRAYCKLLCMRCYQRARHKDHKRVHREHVVEAASVGSVYVNQVSGGRFGVFVGAYDEESFFDPQLVATFDGEGEAEQAARAMIRGREPVTTERIIEEWRNKHRKAWAA